MGGASDLLVEPTAGKVEGEAVSWQTAAGTRSSVGIGADTGHCLHKHSSSRGSCSYPISRSRHHAYGFAGLTLPTALIITGRLSDGYIPLDLPVITRCAVV